MADVAVILPCYGRHDQTLAYAAQLVAAAGAVDAAWVAVGGTAEQPTIDALVDATPWIGVCGPAHRYTYWQALVEGQLVVDVWADQVGATPLLCAVANDVWAGECWLARGLAAYRARFPDREGLMGFAGDGHGPGHSCHFVIGRRLLDHLGGWPTWYQHNFGDTELCLRTQALGRYGKATRAVLEHRHPALTGAAGDLVYALGQATWTTDQELFAARRQRGWS